MADQCIVCLENLEVEASVTDQPLSGSSTDSTKLSEPVTAATSASKSDSNTNPQITTKKQDHNHNIALIHVCGHKLHDSCLREWAEKANSCPICRQSFHLVHVYDKVGGTLQSSYEVEDKKQVAEFDPQAWLDENPEDDVSTPCPVCNLADHEEVLLLCDGCDTPYHTYCLGLDGVPRGAWFCMECIHNLGPELADVVQPPPNANRSSFFPRTQASMRRARQRARSDAWQGAWGQIAGRVWDALSIDLDYHDDDSLEEYRRAQQLRERERREHERWQQRLNIASRAGARDVFASSIQNVFAAHPNPRPDASEQSREERRAWGAFERALESEDAAGNRRKRKSRSITGSPTEPRQEPERKLKRPRTRRLPVQNGEASSSKQGATASRAGSNQGEGGSSDSSARSPPSMDASAPTFLSALLKEVEMSTPSDDESIRHLFGPIPGANDRPSSPASSPSASGYSSPRASSSSPPPQRNSRPISPIMTLSSHIEPIYPPANYSPTRSSPENSESEHQGHRSGGSELRQPRPRRSEAVRMPRSNDVSPARSPLPLGLKEDISSIVRSALKPHWRAKQLNSEQYAAINRDISRKLYDGVSSDTPINDETRQTWEKLAKKEVARAVSELNT
ncbi:hypothetical protein VTK73DRAFT_4169 [Phialemonium thermophilum]|uniref:PHD and RING finger domain-containing protein n=1 Tax=Phialemonium thermophilum TaxID=223376 RepID=A0ABR3XZL8_9PEZI